MGPRQSEGVDRIVEGSRKTVGLKVINIGRVNYKYKETLWGCVEVALGCKIAQSVFTAASTLCIISTTA